MRAKSRAWPAPTVDCKTAVPCGSPDRSAGAGSMFINQADHPSAHQPVGARHAREIAGTARSHSGSRNRRSLRFSRPVLGRRMDVHSSCELPFGAVPCGSAPCARNRGRGPLPQWIAEPPFPAILQPDSQAHDGCSAILRAALQRTTLWERAMRAKSRAWPAPTVDRRTAVPCDSSDRSAGAGSMFIHQADRPSAHQLVGARHAREIAGAARSHSGSRNRRFLRFFRQVRGRMMDVHPSCELPFGAVPVEARHAREIAGAARSHSGSRNRRSLRFFRPVRGRRMDVHSSRELPFSASTCGSAPCARNRGRGPLPQWIAEPPFPAILQPDSRTHDGCSLILRATLRRSTCGSAPCARNRGHGPLPQWIAKRPFPAVLQTGQRAQGRCSSIRQTALQRTTLWERAMRAKSRARPAPSMDRSRTEWAGRRSASAHHCTKLTHRSQGGGGSWSLGSSSALSAA